MGEGRDIKASCSLKSSLRRANPSGPEHRKLKCLLANAGATVLRGVSAVAEVGPGAISVYISTFLLCSNVNLERGKLGLGGSFGSFREFFFPWV